MVFADYNSTWPLEESHLAAVMEALRKFDGNPSSQHASGRRAKVAIEDARTAVSALLGCRPQELVFTSGATESNNLAIQGLAGQATKLADGVRTHVIVGATEHPSVIELAEVLAARGLVELQLAPVDANGIIRSDALLSMIRKETAMVAIMAANNETGAIQPVAELAAAVKARAAKVHFHVDAVQALGKLDCSWIGNSSNVDSAAFSGHKIGAFKGCGALYLKAGTKLHGLMIGGGQERSRRPGTENVPGIVSFGIRARELAVDDGALWKRWVDLQREAQKELVCGLAGIPGAVVHGDPAAGLANTLNFHVSGVGGDDILLNLDLAGIAASSGSACSSGVGRPSHVLKAMGYDDWVALNSVRISLGSGDPLADVSKLIGVLDKMIRRVKRTL